MKMFLKICGAVHALCLIMLILFLGIHISAFGMWFYQWQFSQTGNDGLTTYERVNMHPDDLHEVTAHLIRYMQGRLPNQYREAGADRNIVYQQNPVLQITTTISEEMRPFFSDIEIRHMHDVAEIFRFAFILRNVLLILLLLTTVAFVLFGRNEKYILFYAWQYTSAAVAFGLIALAVMIAVNWRRAFIIFHLIFFSNDEWILDANVDLLINIVPYSFFETLSAFIGLFFAVGLIIMFAMGKLLAGRERQFRRSY